MLFCIQNIFLVENEGRSANTAKPQFARKIDGKKLDKKCILCGFTRSKWFSYARGNDSNCAKYDGSNIGWGEHKIHSSIFVFKILLSD